MKELQKSLLKHGYHDSITFDENVFKIAEKDIALTPKSLFFVDAGFRVLHTYLFAISSPKHEVRGTLLLSLDAYHTVVTSAFSEKFDIEVENMPKEVTIRRQYGMRKILHSEFDSKRYILRVGFPDFPTCPFGHTFKILGYDNEENTYVRLATSILKDTALEKIEYKE